jgi:hypothetical protein
MGALLWLASYPKSGNTWLRAFLHNLLINPDAPVSTNELNKFTTSDLAYAWYAKFTDKAPRDLSRAELVQLRQKVHRDLTQVHPDTVFVKTHTLLGEVEGLPLINMDVTAGAIYIVRNPLDVSISLASHLGVSIDDAIEVMAAEGACSQPTDQQVMEFWGSWSSHVHSWTAVRHNQLLVLRYEDMHRRSLATFRHVVRFLGLQPPKKRLTKAINYSSFKTLKELEEQQGFAERSEKADRFFRRGQPGEWKNTLEERQIARIVNTQQTKMREFGYMTRSLEAYVSSDTQIQQPSA